MKYALFPLLLFFFFLVALPCRSLAFQDDTTSTNQSILDRKVISASYINLFTNDIGFRRSEGISISLETIKYRTRVSLGVSHCKIEKKRSSAGPLTINIDGTSTIAGIDFDLTLDVNNLTYRSQEVLNIYDTFLFGDYTVYRKIMKIGSRRPIPFKYETSHQFNIRLGTGIKLDIQNKTKTYYIYTGEENKDKELFDTIENPVSGSKSSGLMYYITNSIDYRFSLLNLGIYSGFNFQNPRHKSFIMFNVGGSF